MNSERPKLSVLVAVCALGLFLANDALAARGGHSGGRGGGRHGHGHHHHRVFVGASAGLFIGSWYQPGYYPGYYPEYAYLQPPLPTYYIERGDQDAPADTWFYCPSAGAYFPTVIECATGWQRVPAQP